MKQSTLIPIKDQKAMPSIQSNVTHVEGVESSSIYTIRAVMLCMLKVSKVAQYTL